MTLRADILDFDCEGVQRVMVESADVCPAIDAGELSYDDGSTRREKSSQPD